MEQPEPELGERQVLMAGDIMQLTMEMDGRRERARKLELEKRKQARQEQEK